MSERLGLARLRIAQTRRSGGSVPVSFTRGEEYPDSAPPPAGTREGSGETRHRRKARAPSAPLSYGVLVRLHNFRRARASFFASTGASQGSASDKSSTTRA